MYISIIFYLNLTLYIAIKANLILLIYKKMEFKYYFLNNINQKIY